MAICTCLWTNGSENIGVHLNQRTTICAHGPSMHLLIYTFVLIALPLDCLLWDLWYISTSHRRVRTWIPTLTRSRHRKRSPGTSPCDDTLWAWVTPATRWVTDQTRESTGCAVFLMQLVLWPHSILTFFTQYHQPIKLWDFGAKFENTVNMPYFTDQQKTQQI